MATAQQIMEAGLARATTNDAGKLNSDGELLGRLNRVFMSLFAMAARQRPEEFSSSATITLAGSPATSLLSAATPALTDVIDIRRVMGSTGTVAAGVKIHLVRETEVYRTYQITPKVFRRGLAIVSGASAGDPVAADVLQLIVLDSPAPLAALSTNVDTRFPVRHHEILVNDVALYLDAKDSGRDASQFQRLQMDQKMKMMAFAAEYDLKASALESIFNDQVAAAVGG